MISFIDEHRGVFGVEPTAVTGEMRAKIKAMNYGLAYGLSAFGLSGQLKISVSEAKGLMEEYFERFGHVRDYLAGIVDDLLDLSRLQTGALKPNADDVWLDEVRAHPGETTLLVTGPLTNLAVALRAHPAVAFQRRREPGMNEARQTMASGRRPA